MAIHERELSRDRHRAAPDITIDQFNSGDEDAFKKIYPSLINYSKTLLRGRDGAEDLVQQAIVRCMPPLSKKNANDFKETNGSVKPYLKRAMANIHINEIRARQRRENSGMVLGHELPDDYFFEDPSQNVEKSVLDKVAIVDLKDKLDQKLGKQFTDVLIKVEVDGKSYNDTASEMGTPIGTVMSRLHRAKEKARIKIGQNDSDENKKSVTRISKSRKENDSVENVIFLVDRDGLSLTDAAKVLGVPVGTVKSRLSRARKALRESA
jgi:RNA polymerase sigma-70 factor, ECF subfamily